MASAPNSKRKIIDLDSASADEGEDSPECRGQPQDREQQATLDLDSDPFGVCPGNRMMIELSSDEGEKQVDSEAAESEQEQTLADLPLTAAALEALQRDLPPVVEQEEAGSEASSTGAFNAVGPPRRSRRHPRCAGPACNFSTKAAGQPSRVTQESEKCMWCNREKFSRALATSAGRARINTVLNQLQRAACKSCPLTSSERTNTAPARDAASAEEPRGSRPKWTTEQPAASAPSKEAGSQSKARQAAVQICGIP